MLETPLHKSIHIFGEQTPTTYHIGGANASAKVPGAMNGAVSLLGPD
jgi:hypothetical protein